MSATQILVSGPGAYRNGAIVGNPAARYNGDVPLQDSNSADWGFHDSNSGDGGRELLSWATGNDDRLVLVTTSQNLEILASSKDGTPADAEVGHIITAPDGGAITYSFYTKAGQNGLFVRSLTDDA